MSDAFNALDKALYDRLRAQVTLAPVYQHVPEDTPPPVVIIGDQASEAIAVKGGGSYRVEIDIVTVITSPGRKPFNALQAEVRAALEGWTPVLTAGSCGDIYALTTGAQLTEDGRSYVGSQRFGMLLQV